MFNKLYKSITKYIKENFKFILLLIALVIILNIKLPFGIYMPGGLINVSDRLTNELYTSEGSFNLTYVGYMKGNVTTLLLALINPKYDIVSNKNIKMDNESLEEANLRDKILLYSSISNATKVAYESLGMDLNVTGKTTYVTYSYSQFKNDFKVGDRLISIDGNDINDIDIKEYINSKNEGDILSIKVKRDSKEKTINAKLYSYEDKLVIGIGYSKVLSYKDVIKYKYKDSEAGPSGGLMLTLSIYNALTEDDLTKGLTISGTGTIDEDGNVGEIGGVKYKLEGAVKKNASIFICPTANYEEAINLKEKNNYDITIIEAKTFDQVLEELLDL